MVLPIIYNNNTKVYNVSGYDQGKLPDWLLFKHRKVLKKDPEFSKRIELIQDFEFPEASNAISFTPNEKHIVATGVYKPQIRVYELDQLTLKFERHTNAENVKFRFLAEDWTKLLLLQVDRSIELHTQGGIYYSTRIPKFGRDIVYDKSNCDAVVVGSGNEAYRLNLEQGRFLKSWETSLSGINAADINPQHRLFSLGGEGGLIEYWDPRYRKRVGGLNVSSLSFINDPNVDVSAIHFLPDGLSMAVGTNHGIVLLYDLRHPAPFIYKDHQYRKIVKIWNKREGNVVASVEPPNVINDISIQQKTGYFMIANDGMQIQSFYAPTLGPAPKWCSFLDNLTEELEENPQPTVYDNYKFVTKKDLSQLGLDHLIGTAVLKAYMHGFFIDYRLYEKAKAIANPFAYEEYRKKQIQNRIAQERATRISGVVSLPKVNKALAKKLLSSELNKKKKNKPIESTEKSELKTDNPLGDDRFRDLFMNPDFEVDEESPEYKLLHPSLVSLESKKKEETMRSNESINPEFGQSASEDEGEGSNENDFSFAETYPSKFSVAYPAPRRSNDQGKKKEKQTQTQTHQKLNKRSKFR